MSKSSIKRRRQEAFAILAAKMDARDKAFEEMKKIESAGNELPPLYKNNSAVMLNYESYKMLGHWRNQPNKVEGILEAAKKAAKKAR